MRDGSGVVTTRVTIEGGFAGSAGGVQADFFLPSGLAQTNTRTLRPTGTWFGGNALMLPLTAALRNADSRGQGCLLPAPDGHMGGDFQRGCAHTRTDTYTHTHTHREGHVSAQPGAQTEAFGFHTHTRGVKRLVPFTIQAGIYYLYLSYI